MKTKTGIWKRLLCVLLVAAMAAALLPAFAVTAEAAGTQNYVTLPITIRDFAADGMLFEWNEIYEKDDTVHTSGTSASYTYYAVNPTSWSANSYKGIRILTYGKTVWTDSSVYWHTIICNSSGQVVKVIPNGTSKGDSSSGAYKNAMKSGYYAIWVWSRDETNYNNLSVITESNKSSYKITYSTYSTSTKNITVTKSSGTTANAGTYHNASNKGFGMLMTDSYDKFNVLPSGTDISGTQLISNGEWDSETVPTPKTVTLNSGAKQTVYGALIRTNLVEPTLGEGKKLVYTRATVEYLAGLLSKTLPVAWQNPDGTYNMWHVMGQKLSDSLKGQDLATVLRTSIQNSPESDKLGTYEKTVAHYAENPNRLNWYNWCYTYTDAAYYLLHNTFNSITGYGVTIPNYHSLNLVEKTVNGKTTYVFNSAYDGASYDPIIKDAQGNIVSGTGTISNTQTTTITPSYDDEDGDYVRGNIQPENRFNPIAALGYGKSGNTYLKARDNTQKTYYDNVNYNLTLEGHAQFIYYEDADLYFNFTGDDDVYLFINGIRVLDLGGGHAIAKAGISLNDVAALCGLKDGEVYDFDFYYMERHGTAANFGIETNIRIVDPSMITTKEGYQNGVSTGYNGYVDALNPVVYSFGLQNNGEAAIQNLTFRDDAIGVTLTKDSITLNQETTMDKLRAVVYNADKTVKEYVEPGNLTEAKLKELLTAGLGVGERIFLHGFRHTITETEWANAETGKDTFPNRVYTTAEIAVDNTTVRTLNGTADWRVQKKPVDYKSFHVYEWMGKGVTVTKDELLDVPFTDKPFDPATATVILCSPSGSTTGAGVNEKAKQNDDGSVTYKGDKTGSDAFFYMVKQNDQLIGPVEVDVYSYDVADNTYVLDYGLAVELNGDEFGLMVNDTLDIEANFNITNATVTGISEDTNNYGEFSYQFPSLKYTPKKIMNDIDTVNVTVQVCEVGQRLSKFTGVEMTEKVTTAPANVVYYEENFPGITYVNEGENQWAHYETVDENGNSVAGTEQSADQNSNYGSDPNYEADKTGEWDKGAVTGTTSFQLDTTNLDTLQASAIEQLNQYLGLLPGSDSNGTVNVLEVKETAEVMYFDFTGTGFEILSRTTDEQYAVINVTVYKDNGDGTYTVVKQKPVITESKGGDLYQVPVISITGLPRDNYRVSVKAAGSTETKTRVLYIDGIRIYGPLDDDKALEYYNPEEYQAKFMEVKQLVKDGKAIYVGVSEDEEGSALLVTGVTMIEDVSKENGVLTEIESVEDYMKFGPNNELYLTGDAGVNILTFFLTPDENTPEGARTIEVGAHRKVDDNWLDTGSVNMVYGSTADAILEGTNSYTVSTGTEQYFSIDISKLTKDTNGRYLLMVGTNRSENGGTTLALTNLKVSGYTISMAEQQMQTAYAAMALSDDPVIQQTRSISAALKARKQETEQPTEEPTEVVDPTIAEEPTEVVDPTVPEEPTESTEPTVETTPSVNENLVINSAALKASKVVTGKTATLTVKATAEAARIEVIGPDGTTVTPTREQTKTGADGTVTFLYMWTVTGSRGDELVYTINVYDANDLPAVNSESVTVTIK